MSDADPSLAMACTIGLAMSAVMVMVGLPHGKRGQRTNGAMAAKPSHRIERQQVHLAATMRQGTAQKRIATATGRLQ